MRFLWLFIAAFLSFPTVAVAEDCCACDEESFLGAAASEDHQDAGCTDCTDCSGDHCACCTHPPGAVLRSTVIPAGPIPGPTPYGDPPELFARDGHRRLFQPPRA